MNGEERKKILLASEDAASIEEVRMRRMEKKRGHRSV
jgi:hypothetical protein